MGKAKDGKSGRKIGRNARRPSTARRKALRPDLLRKARNVIRQNGEASLPAWVEGRIAKGDPSSDVYRARDKALAAAKERAS